MGTNFITFLETCLQTMWRVNWRTHMEQLASIWQKIATTHCEIFFLPSLEITKKRPHDSGFSA